MAVGLPDSLFEALHFTLFPYYDVPLASTASHFLLTWPGFGLTLAAQFAISGTVKPRLAHNPWLRTIKLSSLLCLAAADAYLVSSLWSLCSSFGHSLLGNQPNTWQEPAAALLVSRFWLRTAVGGCVGAALGDNLPSVINHLMRFITLRHEASGQILVVAGFASAFSLAQNIFKLMGVTRVGASHLGPIQQHFNALGGHVERFAICWSYASHMYYPRWYYSFGILCNYLAVAPIRYLFGDSYISLALVGLYAVVSPYVLAGLVRRNGTAGNGQGSAPQTPNWLPVTNPQEDQKTVTQRQRIQTVRQRYADLFDHQDSVKLANLFESCDTNGDGIIDSYELRSLLEKVSSDPAVGVEEIMADAGAAGGVDFETFVDKAAQVRRSAASGGERSQFGQLMSQLSQGDFLSSRILNMNGSGGEAYEDRDRLCVVCLENDRQLLVQPCNHFCLCEPCAEQMNRFAQEQAVNVAYTKCPVCRGSVTGTVRVYM